MRAYVYDDIPGDQRKPHDSGQLVTQDQLKELGVLYWQIPQKDGWEGEIDKVAKERDYKNRDIINVTREGLGEAYESKIKGFFEEHLHEDEEIRYILDGSGFFDVRDHTDKRWVRIAMDAGDLVVLPAGIYHRFTLDEQDKIKAMRLFKVRTRFRIPPRNHGGS
ncbi:Acireductone dioxygenase 1 [Naganishia vaughanmartiniae]|uniref:Acireductone dioxygenase 1 n=1 Tax=Naganishia vaughanmartiniae TaxID=1424756 RepID=A0ACC2X3D8_9TREE|nr:Acireductone dioxygenase 1 [Naganishia vaughanmartiniae]